MASEIGKIVHCKICGAPIEARGNRLYCPVCYNQNRRNAAQRSNARTKMEREQTKREEAKMKENNRIATSAAELNMRAKLSNLGGISYDIFLQVKPRDREYHIGALYDMLFCAGDGERLTQDNLVAIEQNSVKANVQKEGLLHRAKNRPIQESEIEKQESASSETESKTDVEDDEP